MRCYAFCLLLLLIAGGCGSTPSAHTPLAAIAVTISPATHSAVAGGALVALSAAIHNDATNQGVSWNLNPTTGCGSLSASSGLSGAYLPPSSLSKPCNATVTVSSVADSTKIASVTVTVDLPITVAISPDTAQNVLAGMSSKLSATVSNDPSGDGVAWTFSPLSGCGTLSAINSATRTVTYVAPVSASLTSSCTATLTATALADKTKSASLPITVTPIHLSLSPNKAIAVATSSTVSLTASALNGPSNSGLKWSLTPTSGCGTLSAGSGSSVVFTAPIFSALSAACTATVAATSLADNTKSASVPITVNLLATWFNGGIAGKKIVYWGNSTVSNNYELLRDLGAATVPGGSLQGMEFRTDLQGVECDASGDITVTLSAPSNYQVGQWVSLWFANPYDIYKFWLPSVRVSAVSGSTFSYVNSKAPQTSYTRDMGYVTGAILNFGNNGAALGCLLTGCGPYPIQTVCDQKPDLLIIRGPLINDVRLGHTDLVKATSLEQTALQTLRACSPETAILLTTENSLLSTDTSQHWVQPNADAQQYSDIIHDAVMAMNQQFPNVEVLDIMKLVYGTTAPPSSPYMGNQLHENNAGAKLEIEAILPLIGTK